MAKGEPFIDPVETRPAPGIELVAATSSERQGDLWRTKSPKRIRFDPSGTMFMPTGLLAWGLGLLGAFACVAPWVSHGWLWFEAAAVIVGLVLVEDALSLWLTRGELSPLLLSPEQGLRGREGQTISIPLALVGSTRRSPRGLLRVAVMPSSRESETAIRTNGEPEWLKLERPRGDADSTRLSLWPWTPEVSLLRRGLWAGLRIGIERKSRLGVWCLRRWFDSPEPLRIETDIRSGRKQILRSPVYRSLVAARQTPWTGHGRDFERLREYQPGDNYTEIAWKTTARRGAPVTRLFQWEQKQEVYFVVDQSRSSAIAAQNLNTGVGERAPRRLLDLAVETALVGATVALELGDEFGLVTFADEPKSWLRAGNGQSHFHQFRDRLVNLEPLATGADYEQLFTAIRARLRRRAYLVLLADLAERAAADSLSRGIAMVRSSHVVLMTSLLPAHARPAFLPDDDPRTDEDVYTALAGEKENHRLRALARQLEHWDVKLRFVPADAFLRTAVEGYLEGKREQRL